jgi:hypothetical protein
MVHLGAVVERDVGDVEQRGPKRVRSLCVVIERVDHAPNGERNHHAGKAFLVEFALISDGEKEESGNHDEKRHADAQE